MVESITGSVPLGADTPLGTIGLRQERAIAVSPEVGALAPVLERACAAEPDARYPSADAMRGAIAAVAERMPPPGPLVLAGLGAVGEDPHPTQVVRPVRELSLFDQDQPHATPAVARPASVARVPQRTRSAAPFLLGAVIAIAIAAAAFVVTRPDVGPTVAAPLLVGKTFTQAQDAALGKNLLVDKTYRKSDDPHDTVIAQDPAPGGFTNERSYVHLVLSTGPPAVALPELSGKTQADATKALASQFAVKVVTKTDETLKYPKGTVITSEPINHARPDSQVTLVVSNGPPLVEVPAVADRGYADAANRIKAKGFVAARSDQFNDTVPAGQVVGTTPGVGQQVPKGATVTIVVSKGPDLVVVPNFKNMTRTLATTTAVAQGVQIQAQGVISPGHPVRAQDPAPGTKVKRGTVVTIFF
jgi:serine/threonine-protein kinase